MKTAWKSSGIQFPHEMNIEYCVNKLTVCRHETKLTANIGFHIRDLENVRSLTANDYFVYEGDLWNGALMAWSFSFLLFDYLCILLMEIYVY